MYLLVMITMSSRMFRKRARCSVIPNISPRVFVSSFPIHVFSAPIFRPRLWKTVWYRVVFTRDIRGIDSYTWTVRRRRCRNIVRLPVFNDNVGWRDNILTVFSPPDWKFSTRFVQVSATFNDLISSYAFNAPCEVQLSSSSSSSYHVVVGHSSTRTRLLTRA